MLSSAKQSSAMQYRLGLGRRRGRWRAGELSLQHTATATIAKVAAVVWSWRIQFSAAKDVKTVSIESACGCGSHTHYSLALVQLLLLS